MSSEEFKILLVSIGFEYNYHFDIYTYKEFSIYVYSNYYHFANGSGWNIYYYNYLDPILVNFKKELRSIKLKQLLK